MQISVETFCFVVRKRETEQVIINVENVENNLKYIANANFFTSFKSYSLMVNQSVQINCKNYRVRSELQQSTTGEIKALKKSYHIWMMEASLSQETSLHLQTT